HAAAGYAIRYPPVGPRKRNTPGAPSGVNTGRPAAPAARYNTMLAAPATGPNIMPARITSIGWTRSGTHPNAHPIHTPHRPRALPAPKRAIRVAVSRLRERECVRVVIYQFTRDTLRATASPPPRHNVASPRRAFRSFIAYSSVVNTRAPLAPMGCPSAIAPP